MLLMLVAMQYVLITGIEKLFKIEKIFDNDEDSHVSIFLRFRENDYKGISLHSGQIQNIGYDGGKRWHSNSWDRALCRD